jgi:hypothetical protein
MLEVRIDIEGVSFDEVCFALDEVRKQTRGAL